MQNKSNEKTLHTAKKREDLFKVGYHMGCEGEPKLLTGDKSKTRLDR